MWLQTAEAEMVKQHASHQKAQAEGIKAKAPAKRLALAIAQRRWQVGLPQFHVGEKHALPYARQCYVQSRRE